MGKPLQSTGRSTLWALAALLAGVAAGSLIGSHKSPMLDALGGIGTLWVNALRMIALPLAIANTLCAMVSERAARTAGRIGGAVAIYLALLLLGAGIVLTVVPPVLRGVTVDSAAIATMTEGASAQAQKLAGESHSAPGIADMLVGLVPRNLVRSAVNEEFLPLLVFTIVFGLALRRASPEKGGTVIRFIEGVTETLMVLVRWIVWCSPVAMFALAATFAASSGAHLVGILGRFVLLECALMLGFVLLLYPLTMLAGGLSFKAFARPALVPQMVAISTRSSLAALPALLAAGENIAPSNPEPGRIILPLAVNIFKVNRTTSALCRLLVIFHFWAIPASPSRVFPFLLTVILLSFSELGLPGGTQFRTLPAYLAAGCPIEAVVLLEVFEPLSDICKTLLNVTGDLSVAAIVTRWSERRAPTEFPAGLEQVAAARSAS
ncbi:MAG TPA: cation:dicarboxylase symporter family transporter [Bryobacteraceae bacterium]|nr:cation:dicarboxylase symporter family transporter [Bryobacteraceae bacterium]